MGRPGGVDSVTGPVPQRQWFEGRPEACGQCREPEVVSPLQGGARMLEGFVQEAGLMLEQRGVFKGF